MTIKCYRMECKMVITILLLILGVTKASITVNMSHSWLNTFGWNLTCIWGLEDAPLQSVRLYKDNSQFFIYRPEKHGNTASELIKVRAEENYSSNMMVRCFDLQKTGKCEILIELLKAPNYDSTYKCEVSEEKPRFQDKEVLHVLSEYVSPTYPEITASRNLAPILNCTSLGTPAPRLHWHIGEQRIPENFSNRVWDKNQKLWLSWSVITPPRSREDVVISCSALVSKPGHPSTENITHFTIKGMLPDSAGKKLGITNMLLIASIILANLR